MIKIFLTLLIIILLSTPTHGARVGDKVERYGIQPDKFVSAAPLVVAASCSDGVAMIALHSPMNDILLGKEDSIQNDELVRVVVKDLPSMYRGPRRIHVVDGFGSSLLCAGWRTDGDTLANQCRSLAADELDRFGEPSAGQDYGRFLAYEASFYLAQCACLDNSRALSCVGLLAVSGKDQGILWLIDATGAYQVRAHAVGNGAKDMNALLRKVDFASMTGQECIEHLMRLLTEDSEDNSKWKVPPNSRVEMALIQSANKIMKRVRQPFLTVV